MGHPNSKIANSMKLVTFAFFSSQYHVFELKNIRGNLIAPNSNRWSLSNENAMFQEDYRTIISQEKSIENLESRDIIVIDVTHYDFILKYLT